MNIVTTIFSAVFVLFIPGLALSFIFFKPNKIDVLERLALSFALSIAVVPLITFYLNIIGVRISRYLVIAEVLAIVCLSLIWIYVRRMKEGNYEK